MPTNDQIGGIVRALLGAGVAYAAGRGWITSSDGAALITAGTTLALAGWSAYTNRPSKVVPS